MIADDGSSWGVTDTESWVVVASDIIVNKRITVNGTVNLILCDGVSLTAKKGISVLKYPTIGAQRAYFQMNGFTASPNPSEGGGTGVRAFVLNFGDDTQGINAQPIFNLQSSMFNVEAWYDLQGRRMASAEANSSLFTNHSSLKKGLYIHNGRKVVVK